jgi:hypothetical protein
MKISVSFAGKEKKLLLNKTNANAIAAAYGDEETAWGGKELTLYPATTEYKGATVPCIRVITESPEAEEGELDF